MDDIKRNMKAQYEPRITSVGLHFVMAFLYFDFLVFTATMQKGQRAIVILYSRFLSSAYIAIDFLEIQGGLGDATVNKRKKTRNKAR